MARSGEPTVNVGLYIGIGVLVVVIAVYAFVYVRARRRGIQQGATRIARCSEGHLFTSTVIPGASFRAVRLGSERYQRCPVGNHWSLVRWVDPSTLTPEEREAAAAVRDTRIP